MKALMFALASVRKTSSLPVLRMLSPQQLSRLPRIPKSTPARLRMSAVAAATFFSRGS